MLRKGKDGSVGLSAPAKLEPVVTLGKASSKPSAQQQWDRPSQALVDRRNRFPTASPSSSPPPPDGDKDEGKKQAGSSMYDKKNSAGPVRPPTSSKVKVAGRADVDGPPRGGGGGRTAGPETEKTSNKGERSVDADGKAAATAAAATAPTHFIPKVGPWRERFCFCGGNGSSTQLLPRVRRLNGARVFLCLALRARKDDAYHHAGQKERRGRRGLCAVRSFCVRRSTCRVTSR